MTSTGQCINWRQKSALAAVFADTHADILERHLISESAYVELDINPDILHRIETGNLNLGDLKFPKLDDSSYKDSCGTEDLFGHFTKNATMGNVPQESRDSTLNSFLNIQSNRGSCSFTSAREMLTLKALKKSAPNSTPAAQKATNGQYTDFNFTATKKSLGSLGRITHTAKKNFVSPARTKSAVVKHGPCEDPTEAEMEPLITHPALKNVDAKMVEMISNEIIHTFKSIDWNDIAGLNYAKSIIKEAVVYPLLRPDIFTGLRRPPRGILLFGPPGTGKTLIGKCIASQSSATFFSISSASLTSKWMGEGEKMVRALFAVAQARQPSVIFIDEVDSLLSQRSETENEGTRRLKTEFLIRLDGACTTDDDRVLIVGATNRPQELDEAVRRRFVKRLYVPLPELDARVVILTNLLKTVNNDLDANDLNEIAQMAEGYSGADIDSLCREASMEPLRSLPFDLIMTYNKDALRAVNKLDFRKALEKVRPSVSQKDLDQYVEWNKTYGSSF